MPPSTLQDLAQIITDGVKTIDATCAQRGAVYPSTDVLFSSETDAVQHGVAKEAAPVLAAAYQLIATLSPPHPYLIGLGFYGYIPAALNVVERGFVPDILREAEPKALHVNDIAAISKVDPKKLTRVLRLLASRHIFEEVEPNVFKNSRLSSALCLERPVSELVKNPDERWVGTNGIAAISSFHMDEGLKAASYLGDNMFDPSTSHSEDANKAPIQRAMHTNLPIFEWLEKPENATALRKFHIGFGSMGKISLDAISSQGFAWSSLPEGSTVVDVAGGVGNVSMTLIQKYPHLRYVVQDRAPVIQHAHDTWEQQLPGRIESGAVKLQVHDIFAKQPVTGAAVFFMRFITHDWSDKYCAQILRHLRDAAMPTTKLIIVDHILDYLCPSTGSTSTVPGAARLPAPGALRLHPDSVSGYGYLLDLNMMGVANCQERTLGEYLELFRNTGWKLERIHRTEPVPQLVCVPSQAHRL